MNELVRRMGDIGSAPNERAGPGAADQGGAKVVSAFNTAGRQLARRSRQLKEIWSAEGHRGLTNRARKAASGWLRPKDVTWQVFPEDIMAADLSRPFCPEVPKLVQGEPIRMNWVMGPAGPGSGGHTTNFRIIKYLEGAGYSNRVYFYDSYRGDHKYYENIARTYYGVKCPILNARDGLEDAHAVVATGWPSAYAVFNARCRGKRFYFVQDYEPYFDPVGANSVLAENTYRMGFHTITAGNWLAQKLKREFGTEADYFPFGCDTSRYRYDPHSKRTGIVFFARMGTPRRGTELGLLGIEIFAKRQPHIELHLYGDRMGDLPFRYVNHGTVAPAKLNDIYNRCFAGLSLSLTNVSLVPYEMLAAGCIPIVNDADHNRMVLNNSFVRYTPSTPHAIADALEEVVNTSDFKALARQAAESVSSATWDDAGAAVDSAFRRALGDSFQKRVPDA